jgi:hypothetical protein
MSIKLPLPQLQAANPHFVWQYYRYLHHLEKNSSMAKLRLPILKIKENNGKTVWFVEETSHIKPSLRHMCKIGLNYAFYAYIPLGRGE